MATVKSKERNGVVKSVHDVLTLPEAAAYLRVPEAAIVALAEGNGIPARRIGDDWRFLRHAIVEWLHSETREPAPGSKEALLQHFGVFKDDGDLEEQLAKLRKLRDESRQ